MSGHAEQLRVAEPVAVEARTILELRWSIASEALGRGRPDLSIGEFGAPVTLRWEIELARAPRALHVARAEAWLEDDAGASCRIEQASTLAAARGVEDGDLLHVDLPGVLVATVRTTPSEPRILYARTTVLERLGLTPGAYEPRGCSLEHAPPAIHTNGARAR